MKRSIMIFSESESWNGAEKFWSEAIDQPAFAEFAVHVMMPLTEGNQARKKSIEDAGGTVHLSRRSGRLVRSIASAVLSRLTGSSADVINQPWFRCLVNAPPDLAWFHLAGIGEVGWLNYATELCRRHGIPYWLVVQHSPENFFFGNDEQRRQGQKILESADRVIFISRKNREAVERALGQSLANAWMARNALRAEFIERAAKSAQESPVRADGTARLINLARLDPTCKGQHLMLAALADPIWKHRDWTLLLQGGGCHAELLPKLIHYYGLGQRVVNADHVADVVPALAGSDLLLLPSLSEGTPYALIESMACARPAVATAVGGNPELVEEGRTGWLSPSTEAADFGAAMERAWNARVKWHEFGAEAQRRVHAGYDLRQTLPELAKVLLADATRRVQ